MPEEADERLSSDLDDKKQLGPILGLVVGLGVSIPLGYLVVSGNLSLDPRLHTVLGGNSEDVIFCVSLLFYIGAMFSSWRLGCLPAVLVTSPICFLVVVIAWPFLSEKLNSLSTEFWMIWFLIGFLVWQKQLISAINGELLDIKETLAQIKESVRILKNRGD